MMANNKQSTVLFYFLANPFAFPKRNILKRNILELFRLEGTEVESMTYIFCTDEYLLTMNQDFLSHDYYTDIITFNLAEVNQPLVGEVYISVDRVRDNAKELQQPFGRELRRVIFHGALHLCGYKDKTKKQIALMRQKEDYYLTVYNT